MCSQTRWLGLMAIALAVGSFPASPGQTVSRGPDPMQLLLRAEPRCPRTSSSGTAVAAPCVRTLGSLRGGCGAERSEVVIEGPRALPGPTFHDMFGLAGAEGGDAEGSGDEAEEDSHVTGGLRAALRATALTPEERASFFEQWQDDSRWTNLTLMPLTHGEEMPEELQWEQERLHGDLALYRRTFIPTPTYLKWKASEDARAAAAEVARLGALASADDITMSSSATSDSEPNWYFQHTDEGQRRLMFRPQYSDPRFPGCGKAYVPFTTEDGTAYADTNGIDPGDLGCGEEVTHSVFGETSADVDAIVDLHLAAGRRAVETIQQEEPRVQEQIRRARPREGEGERVLDCIREMGQVPAPDDVLWDQAKVLGIFTRDHGIRAEELAAEASSLRRRWLARKTSSKLPVWVGSEGCRTMDEGGRYDPMIPPSSPHELVEHNWSTRLHIAGGRENTNQECGRWLMGVAASGALECVSVVFRASLSHEDVICGSFTPNATLTIAGGPWDLQACSITCEGALALRARLCARVSLLLCFLGGNGPLTARAQDGLVARTNASLELRECVVAACLYSGARAHEDAVVKWHDSVISRCGFALGCYGNSFTGFYGGVVHNLSMTGALHTEPEWTRTARVELVDAVVHGWRLWCRDGAPEWGYTKVPRVRRCLQRRVRLVHPASARQTRAAFGGSEEIGVMAQRGGAAAGEQKLHEQE